MNVLDAVQAEKNYRARRWERARVVEQRRRYGWHRFAPFIPTTSQAKRRRRARRCAR